jgi:diguanylate cyclase (GGDEF)-like protein/PAS domain S-box-containing protein
MASFFARSSRRLLFWVGLGGAITLLSCVGILFERQIREEAEGTGWIEHTHDVIDELLGVTAALGRVESAQQPDATASRDERYIDKIRSALNEADAGASRARALTADNSTQQRRLDEFDGRLRRRLELLGLRVAAVQQGHDPGSAPEAVQLSTGLRSDVEEMIVAERSLLSARAGARTHEAGRTRFLMVAVLIGALLLSIMTVIVVMLEIRLRRLAGVEARAKHALLHSVIEGSSDAVFAKDLAGRYLMINTAGAQLLGLTPADMIGKDDGEILSPDTAAGVMQRDRDILRSGQMGTFDQTATSKGITRTFHTTKGPHRDADGRVIGLIGISRDITRARAEEEGRLGNMNLQLRLSELLQACRSVDEAYGVIAQAAPQFFVEQSGALYLFHASRNHLEAQVSWGDQGKLRAEHPFGPDDCWALRRGQRHLTDGSGLAVTCRHLPEREVRAALCVPLQAHGEVMGILHLRGATRIDEQTIQRAAVVAEQIGMALANLQLREKLRNQSIRDPLTGLFNRRYAEETLTRELHRATRGGQSLAVLAIDVDHFKRFNDAFGHEVGDQVLRELGALLARSIRGGDVASRIGGEELLVILPDAQLEGAMARAEQIRSGVSQLQIRHLDRPIGPITVSIGVAVFPQHGQVSEVLLRGADAALYRAKHQGRNRVVVAVAPELPAEQSSLAPASSRSPLS